MRAWNAEAQVTIDDILRLLNAKPIAEFLLAIANLRIISV